LSKDGSAKMSVMVANALLRVHGLLAADVSYEGGGMVPESVVINITVQAGQFDCLDQLVVTAQILAPCLSEQQSTAQRVRLITPLVHQH
jgi:hypothetical protein